MASIVSDPNGFKRILFVAPDGKRKAVRLGKATMKQALSAKVKIEQLVSAACCGGGVDEETARWVAERDDTFHARLVRAGLVKPRNRSGVTLKAFLDEFFGNVPVKPTTAVTYDQTKRCLIDHFGENKPLREIGPADADQWRASMKKEGLADSTISRRVKTARQAFKTALRWKLISENPFADVVAGSQSNKARQFFVTRDIAEKVLAECPDPEWRLLFALSRFGGLRCPSEHLALRWTDVDWEHGRVTVRSPKTEHLEGGDCRVIPLFPELHPYLMEAFQKAPDGAEFVITRYRKRNCNLRTQLERIIRRAGLKPWPKLFHNLRATRQTELAERYPIHVVCAWLGNSRAVAQEHYLQVTDAHFVQAAQEPTPSTPPTEAAHIPAQYTAVNAFSAGKDQESQETDDSQAQSVPGFTDECNYLPEGGLTPTGFEPVLSA